MQTHAKAMVFVHGLVSCGVQGLKDLCPNDVPDPIYRYEHDTFRPIDENARELADLISSRIDTPQLAIVGHSRGGLVARAAAARLSSTYPGKIQIHTFGTPHLGTPLAAIGGRLLNVLFKLGEDFAGAIPMLFPLTKAYGYLWDSPDLPPGIDALREDSPSLGMLNTIGDRCPIRVWAGDFDVHSTESGFGVGIEGLLAGALSDRAHDLVVPTASALAGGIAEPLLNCSHVHYFQQPTVQTALRAFFAPVTPAAQGVRAISSGDDVDGRVEDRGTFLIIGGVRVSKRKTA